MIQFHISKILSRISTRPDINFIRCLCRKTRHNLSFYGSYFIANFSTPSTSSLLLLLSKFVYARMASTNHTKVKGCFFSGVSLAQSHIVQLLTFKCRANFYFFLKLFPRKSKIVSGFSYYLSFSQVQCNIREN